jgi:hypothetical protein
MTGGGAIAATAAAAEKKRREQKEEEEMTQYGSQDMNGWEFKIVRSITARFSNHDAVQRLCAEESKAGWELVEKFDDNRIRFKRRIERRNQDQSLGFDPYRTRIGITELGVAAIVIGAIAVMVAVALLIAR